jgi:anaphase-promoting complex subunit 4
VDVWKGLTCPAQGHKRWDKAVTTGYENIRRLSHQHLLPALERCDVLVCRLQGLSKYQDSNAVLGLSTQDLGNIRDTIRCLKILTQTVLNYAGIELNQFAAFSMWLRHEIDIQAAENSGSTPDDVSDKEGLIEHARVIDYIQGAMTKSKLAEFFPPISIDDRRDQWNLRADGLSLFDIVKKELKKHSLSIQTDRRLLEIRSFYEHLARQCTAVFKQIAEAERRNVLFGRPIRLMKGNKSSIADMRVCFKASIPSIGLNEW